MLNSPQPICTGSTQPCPPVALQETVIRTWAASVADPERAEGRTTGGQVESNSYDAFGGRHCPPPSLTPTLEPKCVKQQHFSQ